MRLSSLFVLLLQPVRGRDRLYSTRVVAFQQWKSKIRNLNAQTFSLAADVLRDDNDESSTTVINEEHQRAVTTSDAILTAMRKRTSSNKRPLNLERDLYDASTGLHSEGVWHNALAGIASLCLANEHVLSKSESTKTHLDAAKRIADSLWKYSWDGTSFRRRSYSGKWDHSTPALEQPNYYLSSDEHRCIQHGMALVFWSELISKTSSSDSDLTRYKEQYKLIAASFIDQFWNEQVGRWTTVSRVQGGGSVLRKSASSNKATLNVIKKDVPYYRAVDQGLGILGCLGILRVMEDETHQQQQQSSLLIMTKSQVVDILQRTSYELLSPNGFGYATDDSARSYIGGLDRNQNFWHDGWSVLALISARQYLWPHDSNQGEEQLRLLVSQLVDRYGHLENNKFDGAVWHWARSQKKDTASGNVRYCGDNALFHAMTRSLDWCPDIGLSKSQSSFWNLVAELQLDNTDGLASVADVYKQVRLHPNTELAALLVWP